MSNQRPHTCIIVDDDHTFVEIISNYISQIPKLVLAGSFSDPNVALEKIAKIEHVDFLFLDIRMELSGIDLARALRDRAKYIIFITSYHEYALEAFQANCDHYLIKPVMFPKFLSAVNDLIKRNHRQLEKSHNDNRD